MIEGQLEHTFSDVDTLADRAAAHPEAITNKVDAD
jgi:hypothetical protein